jgi:hypothetical protein
VGTASALAKSLFGSLAGRYTELFLIDEERWEALVTAAGLYVASLQLHEQVPEERFPGLYEIVQHELPDGAAAAMANCSDFVTRATGSASDPYTFESVLGYWVLGNISGRRPGEDQAQLAYYIGHALTDAFETWWKP